MSNKILVQIDGSNFYNLAKRVSPKTHLSDFSYIDLIKTLINKNNFDVIYYVGEIKKVKNDKKSEELYASQQKFFKSLRKQEIATKRYSFQRTISPQLNDFSRTYNCTNGQPIV